MICSAILEAALASTLSLEAWTSKYAQKTTVFSERANKSTTTDMQILKMGGSKRKTIGRKGSTSTFNKTWCVRKKTKHEYYEGMIEPPPTESASYVRQLLIQCRSEPCLPWLIIWHSLPYQRFSTACLLKRSALKLRRAWWRRQE